MANVLVTGGSGFIAGHVILRLLGEGDHVRTTVRSLGQENAVRAVLAGARLADDSALTFAVTEECHAFTECATYTDVHGAHVMDVGYTDNLRGTFAQACADPATPRTTTPARPRARRAGEPGSRLPALLTRG